MIKRFLYAMLILGCLLALPVGWILSTIGVPSIQSDGLYWRDVSYGSHQASGVLVQWDRSVLIEGMSVDLATSSAPQISTPPTVSSTWKEWIPAIHVRNINIRVSNALELQLDGSIHPAVQLQNDWFSITKEADVWVVVADIDDTRLPLTLPVSNLKWSAVSTMRSTTLHTVWTGTIDNIQFQHPLLGTNVRVPSANTTMTKTLDGWQTRLTTKNSSLDLQLNTSDIWQLKADIATRDLTDWFQIDVPNTVVSGHWELDVTPDSTVLSMEDLGFEGQIHSIFRLQSGIPITYQPIHAEQTRLLGPNLPTWVAYDKLGWTAKSVIAAEDAPFMTHNGFNLEGLNRAIHELRQDPKRLIGGSSITQQVAKNLFTGNRSTLQRKVEEIVYTLALETMLSKKAILSLYLNAIEFGEQIYGIQQAATLYFMKDPENLSIKEAVFLAAILPNPRQGYRRAKLGKPPNARMRIILQNLLDGKQITRAQKIAAEREPLRLLMPVE